MELKATTYDVKDGVALLTLNRPEQLNAINDIVPNGFLTVKLCTRELLSPQSVPEESLASRPVAIISLRPPPLGPRP